MNHGAARMFKESIYQTLRGVMYTIIGALVLTIYVELLVSDKGVYSSLAIGVLFGQYVLYIGGYFIVLFIACYTCQNIALAISFSCTRKRAVSGVFIMECLAGILLIILSVAGAVIADMMGADINLKMWILQAVLISLVCMAVANIGSIITLKLGRAGYTVMVLIMGFAMGIMSAFVKSNLGGGYNIMGGFIKVNAISCITGIIAAFIAVLVSMYIYYLAIRKFAVKS